MRTIFLAVGTAIGFVATTPAQGVNVVDLGGGIHQAVGGMGVGTTVRTPQSHTFMVVTNAGTVIIDTAFGAAAAAHKEALTKRASGPVRAIILTHAHGDHTGGIALWKQPDTQVIAHVTTRSSSNTRTVSLAISLE